MERKKEIPLVIPPYVSLRYLFSFSPYFFDVYECNDYGVQKLRADHISVQDMFKLMIGVVVNVGVLVTIALVGLRQIDIKKATSGVFPRKKAQAVSVILSNRFVRFTFKIELAYSDPKMPMIYAAIRSSENA